MPTTPIQARAERFPLLRPIRMSRSFTALWLGQLISNFGDTMLSVLLPITVYSLTGSTLSMGILMTCLTLSNVLFLPFSGLLADRAPRIPLMIIADVVRMLLLISLTVLSATGRLTVVYLDVFALINGTMSSLFNPAYSAVRAQVFTPDIRTAAISLTQIGVQLARLLGPAIGGVLITFFSPTFGYGFDALSFVASIVSLLFLKIPAPVRISTSDARGLRKYGRDLAGGFHELRKHPWLWVTVAVFSLTNIFVTGIYNVLLPWLIKVHLSLPTYDFGLMTSSLGIGALLGAYLIGRRSVWRRRGLLAYGGTLLQGIAYLFLIFVHQVPLLMTIVIIGGAGSMVFSILWESSLQELVPTESYGRVASLDMLGSFALMPVGYALTGWLAQNIGGLPTMTILAVLQCLLIGGSLLIPSIRKFD